MNLPGPPLEQPKDEPPPTIDVFVQSTEYYYQGSPKQLDEMEGILRGIQEAMGNEVTINVKVSEKALHHQLVRLLDRMNKVDLTNFNIHTLKPQLSK